MRHVMQRETLTPETSDGWQLDVSVFRTARFDSSRRPVMFVPGYGMNGFILSYDSSVPSFVRSLCDEGFEVWVANLRGQGASRRIDKRAPGPALRRLAEEDLATCIDSALRFTQTQEHEIDLIGCSLGGSLSYAYLALVDRARVHSVVAIGAPLRWVEVPAILRAVFASNMVAGALRIRGTRRMAKLATPLIKRAPWMLSLYANADNIDMKHVAAFMDTVEDPHPRTNRDIARWVKHGDMVLRGVNVSEAMQQQTGRLMVIAANRDGIVPEATALSPMNLWGGDLTLMRIGDPRQWYAHADIFVGREAPKRVFKPVANWLNAE